MVQHNQLWGHQAFSSFLKSCMLFFPLLHPLIFWPHVLIQSPLGVNGSLSTDFSGFWSMPLVADQSEVAFLQYSAVVKFNGPCFLLQPSKDLSLHFKWSKLRWMLSATFLVGFNLVHSFLGFSFTPPTNCASIFVSSLALILGCSHPPILWV